METLYRKVAVSEGLPTKEGIYNTSRGFLSYNKIFGWITIQNYTTRSPEWWLEEIPDNSHQIEKLEADKGELLEALGDCEERLKEMNKKLFKITNYSHISAYFANKLNFLIQKHKQ